MATILITAATSKLGQDAVAHLLTLVDPSSIAVTVRDKSKVPASWKGVDVRVADYNDDWTETLRGIERVLLISANTAGEERIRQQTNIINASKSAGVKFIAYTSILYADTTKIPMADSHKATEAAIESSGLSYAFLRNGWYTENYLLGKAGWEHTGKHLSAAGKGRFSTAARKDYAEAAAVVVAKGTEGVLELGGDDSFTYADLVEEASSHLGRTITVEDVSEDTLAAALEKAGLPAGFARVMAIVDGAAKDGALENNSKTLSGILGRPTTPWRETIRAAL